jgi:osmotically-inducible protein OsmY
MNVQQATAERVRAALRHVSQGGHGQSIEVLVDHGDLVLEGELSQLADKKRALVLAAAVPGVGAIIDRLRIAPTVVRDDEAIRADLLRALTSAALLGECSIHADGAGAFLHDCVLFPEGCGGNIELRVEGGLVTLDGEVPCPREKQLAGALAWRVSGCRDVVNGLEVRQPGAGSDGRGLADAVRLVLDEDDAIDATRITVRADGATVILEGRAGSETDSRLAQADAWSVFGVSGVEDHLVVGAP